MSDTPSNMMPLGTKAPDFNLIDSISNQKLSLENLKGNMATVIFFICNHCPFVIHVNPQLVQLAKDYKTQGVNCIAISSNDIKNYPQDAPDKMKIVAKKEGYTFPYLFDSTQAIAQAYNAACTPDFFVFDSDLKLKYRGQLDDSRPRNTIPVTGKDIRHALDCIINKEANLEPQKPSIGCGIKWAKV